MPVPTARFFADQEHSALGTWQLADVIQLKSNIFTAANLTKGSVNKTAYPNLTAAPHLTVNSRFSQVLYQFWGDSDCADDETIIYDFYGWSETGPGVHIGKVTGTLGSFTSPANTGFHTNAHQSIMDEFKADGAYFGCDTYAATNNYETMITAYTTEANFPAWFMLDLTDSQYKYVSMNKAAGTMGGKAGAIYKILSLKRTNPQLVIQ